MPNRVLTDSPSITWDNTVPGIVKGNAVIGGGGGTSGFNVINVKNAPYLAKGDGVTDDTAALQAALSAGVANCRSTGEAGTVANIPVYIPAGIYNITAPLLLTGAFGARVFGAGRFSTFIKQQTERASCIVTNGCQYSHFSDMALSAFGGGEFSSRRGITCPDNVDIFGGGVTNPFGGAFATTVTETSDNSGHDFILGSLGGFVRSPGHVTVAIYAKVRSGRNIIAVQPVNNPGGLHVYFDINAGTVLSHLAEDGTETFVSASINNTGLGAGWWRCIVTANNTDTFNYPLVGIASADLTRVYAGNSSNSVDFYGETFDVGDTPSAYVRQGESCALELDWDNGGNVALQSNTFHNMFFNNAANGVRIALSGFMGSENFFVNCSSKTNSVAGYTTCNFNALQQTWLAGDIAFNGKGIFMPSGSGSIFGVGFQNNNEWDIRSEQGANDGIVVHGCRSEGSNNFVHCDNQNINITGTKHHGTSGASGGLGYFAQTNHGAILFNNCSQNGQVDLGSGANSTANIIENCEFGRDDWASSNTLAYVKNTCRGKTQLGQGTGTFVLMDNGVVNGVTFFQTGGGSRSTPFALTDAATIATDPVAAKTTVFTVTLGAAIGATRQLGLPANLFKGTQYTWIVTQDGSGSRALTYNAVFKFPGGAPLLSTAAGAVDVITAVYDGTVLRAQLTKAYA